MLDTNDGKVLRTMNDVHTPATAVLHVKVYVFEHMVLEFSGQKLVFSIGLKKLCSLSNVMIFVRLTTFHVWVLE